MNAIITGATKGIGKSIAVKLAENGYNLAICSRNQEELQHFAEELKYTGVKIITKQTDCGNKDQVYAFCEYTTSVFSTIDVLVNNAGAFLPGNLLDEPDENFEKQQNINTNAAYYFSKYFGKKMRDKHSGHIFNICSIASKELVENAGSYGVTKSALLSLNNVLRQELSRYNVKVTAILPGSTLTSSWEGTTIPSDRFVQPEDIAASLYSILNLSTGVNVDEIIIKPLKF